MSKAVIKAADARIEPTSEELAEVQAFMSQSGTTLTAIQTKLAWIYAQKRGLDIIAGQITPAIIRGKMTMITRIDGFRVIAERSGDYAGQDPIRYGTSEKTGKLEWAEATVYRKSWGDRGLTVRVYWDEFVPDAGKDFTWKKMPHVMLGKVAEAHALRKAFPNDMSGMYADEEMEQAGVKPGAVHEATPPSEATQLLAEAAEMTRKAQDSDAEGPTTDAEKDAADLASTDSGAIGDERGPDPDEETEKARPKYPRRRGEMTDEEWARKLMDSRHISDSQREWLDGWRKEQATQGMAAAAAVAGEVLDADGNELPDADVDPTRGGSTDPAEMDNAYPELPDDAAPAASTSMESASTTGDLTHAAATILGDELPVMQGDEGSLFESESAIVISTEAMTTAKGNHVFVCWLTVDKQTRIEAVMAQQLADTSGASKVGRGELVEIKGSWTNVGERLVVLAMHIRPAV